MVYTRRYSYEDKKMLTCDLGGHLTMKYLGGEVCLRISRDGSMLCIKFLTPSLHLNTKILVA